MQYDASGKVALKHVYVQSDPRPYFETLRRLDYCIPQLAKPCFSRLIRYYSQEMWVDQPSVVDVGCSYGVNAALLRFDATIDDLYEHYGTVGADVGRDELLRRDRAFVRSRRQPETARFVGLDSSGPALSYALDAGFLDDAVNADLEAGDLTDEQRARLAGADLVVSTGCIGYVGERTIMQVATAASDRLPWMAHFVLRMFPYEPVVESLRTVGYETVKVEGVFKQRRFVSAEEQAQVLDGLSRRRVDTQGLEADGWLYAQLYLSLPPGVAPGATAARLGEAAMAQGARA